MVEEEYIGSNKERTEKIDRNETWINVTNQIRNLAITALGKTKPGCRYIDKETWWWNAEIQSAVRKKKEAFKKWQGSRSAEDLRAYKDEKSATRRAVSSAKFAHHKEMYDKLSYYQTNFQTIVGTEGNTTTVE